MLECANEASGSEVFCRLWIALPTVLEMVLDVSCTPLRRSGGRTSARLARTDQRGPGRAGRRGYPRLQHPGCDALAAGQYSRKSRSVEVRASAVSLKASGFQPYLGEGIKLLTDPLSVEKVYDNCGVYLQPRSPRSCCASMRKAKYEHYSARNQPCQCCPAHPIGVRTTIFAPAPPACSPRSTSPVAR